ncbi:MAG: hypothetical protein J1F67_05090 [Muribaculaceae bacterium]|nr:hypothetical protein [Muribaculaceae bacterium]
MEKQHKVLSEYDGIAIGDLVDTKSKYGCGTVESIIDFDTHIVYYVNTGFPIKLPMKREWIELKLKGGNG